MSKRQSCTEVKDFTQYYCSREKRPHRTELNFALCGGDWVFQRENEGLGEGSRSGGWSRVKSCGKLPKSREGWLGNVIRPSGFAH